MKADPEVRQDSVLYATLGYVRKAERNGSRTRPLAATLPAGDTKPEGDAKPAEQKA